MSDRLRDQFAKEFDKALEYITEIAVADADETELNTNIRVYDKAHLRLVFAEKFLQSETFKAEVDKARREAVVLRSDLARAIGIIQGLGYHDRYLDKRYPEWKEQYKESKAPNQEKEE